MSVVSQETNVQYVTDGSTAVFGVPFYFVQPQDLLVQSIDQNGIVVTYGLTTNYFVQGTTDIFGWYPNGGVVNFIQPLPANLVLLIGRSTPRIYNNLFTDGFPFTAQSVNHSYDKLTLVDQELTDVQYLGLALGPPTIDNVNYLIGNWFKNARPTLQGPYGWVCIQSGYPGPSIFEPFGWITTSPFINSEGPTPPLNPQPGNLWFDCADLQLYIWYDDGNSSQWVPVINQGEWAPITNPAGGQNNYAPINNPDFTGNIFLNGIPFAPNPTVSDGPPPTPVTGQLWFDCVGNQLYVYDDGQWVAATNPGTFAPLVNPTLGQNNYAPGINPAGGQGNYAPIDNPDFTGSIFFNGQPFTASVISTAAVPLNPTNGLLWYDCVGNQLYVFDNGQWVIANNPGVFAPLLNPVDGQNNYAAINNPNFTGTVTLNALPFVGAPQVLPYPPGEPTQGQLWFDCVGLQLYVWDDGQWVQANNQGTFAPLVNPSGGANNYAPVESPDLTGVATARTPAAGDNSNAIATTAFVDFAIASGGSSTAGVSSFNARTGTVNLTLADITGASGAPIDSPAFTGTPTAPTPAPGDSSTLLATTAFVTAEIATIPAGGVTSFNTRTGAVTLTTSDVTGVGGALVNSPVFTGLPAAPTAPFGTSTTQLATTAFVAAAMAAGSPGVTSFNSRTGPVTFQATDLTAVGGALLASPSFTGVPLAPTATPGTSTTQIASTAFVAAAIAAMPSGGVTSFNGRTGAVVLTLADITTAGGAPTASPTFTGTVTFPDTGTWNASGINVTGINASNIITGPLTASGAVNFGIPLPIASGGLGAAVTPTSGQILQTYTATQYRPVTVSGDGTISGGGILNIVGVRNTPIPTLAPGYLYYNGSAFTWSPAATGTVTSITAGNGLTGGTITSVGTIGLAAPVSIANGGTGATTAPSALTSLGAAPINSPTFTGTTTFPDGSYIVTAGANNGLASNVYGFQSSTGITIGAARTNIYPAIGGNILTLGQAGQACLLFQQSGYSPTGSIQYNSGSGNYFDIGYNCYWTGSNWMASGSSTGMIGWNAGSTEIDVFLTLGTTAGTNFTHNQVLAITHGMFTSNTPFTSQPPVAGAGQPTQYYLGGNGGNTAGSLTSVRSSNINIAVGAYFNGSNWVATNTNTGIISMDAGNVAFYQDTGITTGLTYNPTQYASVSRASGFAGPNILTGSWSPNFNFSTTAASVTYTAQSGSWARSGNIVTVSFTIQAYFSGGSGVGVITNVPFQGVSNNGCFIMLNFGGINAGSGLAGIYFPPGTNQAQVVTVSATGLSGINQSSFTPSGFNLQGTFTYQCA